MIRVVSFDIDDTLYDFQSASRHALEHVRRRIAEISGVEDGRLTLEVLIADLERTAEEMANPYSRLHDLRTRAFWRTLQRFGRSDRAFAEDLNRVYLAHRFDDVKLFRGARELLGELKQRYLICAISNGEQDLKQLGLDGMFEFVVFASEAGVDKPDPRIFQLAMSHAACAPREFAHIGDSLATDVAGVQGAGGWGIWLNWDRSPVPAGFSPDEVVNALEEVPEALKRLDGSTGCKRKSARGGESR